MTPIVPPSVARLPELLAVVHERSGLDLAKYRGSTVTRRVFGRMTEVGAATLDDYVARVRADPAEVTVLLGRILVRVTDFFRDPQSWRDIGELLVPELLARVPRGGQLRVWSAGCSTGAEAYSLAISVIEAQARRPPGAEVPVVVYATDVDADALALARAGRYSDYQVRGVPEPLRSRHFERDGPTWVVRDTVRRRVVFGRHDLTSDAGLPDQDLVVCCNTLMYLAPLTQERVLTRFHEALRADGTLVLGRSEPLPDHPMWSPGRHHPRHYHPRHDPSVGTEAEDRPKVADPLATFYAELAAARRRQARTDRALAGARAELRLLLEERAARPERSRLLP